VEKSLDRLDFPEKRGVGPAPDAGNRGDRDPSAHKMQENARSTDHGPRDMQKIARQTRHQPHQMQKIAASPTHPTPRLPENRVDQRP